MLYLLIYLRTYYTDARQPGAVSTGYHAQFPLRRYQMVPSQYRKGRQDGLPSKFLDHIVVVVVVIIIIIIMSEIRVFLYLCMASAPIKLHFIDVKIVICNITVTTSVQSNLAKGRIAVLSSLAVENAFVCRVRLAGTFAGGGRRTVRIVFMRKYVRNEAVYVPPQKLFLSVGDMTPHTIYDSTGSHGSGTQTATRSVEPFLHSLAVYLGDTQTHRPRYVRHLQQLV